jgi:hypothetical protein
MFGFGMQRGMEDTDDVEAVICLFIDDNIGETGNGEFMRSIYGVTAAGEEIEHSIYDAMNAGYDRVSGGRAVTRDVACDLLKVLQGLVAESDRHALRMPKREKNSCIFAGGA